jgi:SAM-dependent methyltransferase
VCIPRNIKLGILIAIMKDWTSGYVTDIGYTYGYYSELNPLRSTLAFINAGLVPPALNGAHCELGFGQGVSVNMHAAATCSSWYATDFNPAQASFAKSLAIGSGADVHIFDQAFSEFCSRSDLPEFDSISLHGIWSWISDENRSVIVDFVRRKLKVGGVLYVSYNTLPGWAGFAPLRHLMTQHAEVVGSVAEGTVSRVDSALQFAKALIATEAAYAKANPAGAHLLESLAVKDRHYLAHEFFNKDWEPMHFATMANWLQSAKLDFACSAHFIDQLDAVNLTPAQMQLVKEITDPTFKQTTRDFMVNQQFRRDYWVKGARRLNPLERHEAMMKQLVVLTSHRPDVPLKISGALGEGALQADIYAPLLDLMADYNPKTIGEICAAFEHIDKHKIMQAVMVLTGAGHLRAAQDEARIAQALKRTESLNHYLMNRARSAGDVAVLASPVTGGGVPVDRFGQLFLLALRQGKKDHKGWAQFVWQILRLQDQNILKDGKLLQSEEENLAELLSQAKVFKEKRLPLLTALKIT